MNGAGCWIVIALLVIALIGGYFYMAEKHRQDVLSILKKTTAQTLGDLYNCTSSNEALTGTDCLVDKLYRKWGYDKTLRFFTGEYRPSPATKDEIANVIFPGCAPCFSNTPNYGPAEE